MSANGFDAPVPVTIVAAKFVMHVSVRHDEGKGKLEDNIMVLPAIMEPPLHPNVVVHHIFEIFKALPHCIVEVLNLVDGFCFGLVVGSFCVVIWEVEPGGAGIN